MTNAPAQTGRASVTMLGARVFLLYLGPNCIHDGHIIPEGETVILPDSNSTVTCITGGFGGAKNIVVG